ncbi:MAG: N-acetylmuramoyl-L-alanine amidase [Deltaproteobacteria bacterium]|nr:N-acetylmuramoyl-L-alanine amidase [Deltaproteobacteria bacterium]MBW2594834.1 N-acetylmuramoyl-L-alanine amidase [Deltaproteobacteria bacterium]
MITESKKLIHAAVLFMLLVFPLSAAASGHVVVIDPGHGAANKGVTLSRNVHEKDVTLAVARLVKKSLSGVNNIRIRLTRLDDRDVSMANRKKIVERSNADLFISLHVNAGFGQNAEGYEIYYLGSTVPSAKKSNSGEILKDMEQTRRLNNSVRFAQIVQKNVGRVFPRKGRGLRNAPVLVLQSLTAPAVLLEAGFATNLKDRKKLKDEKIQKDIADALTKSIKEYFSTGGAS